MPAASPTTNGNSDLASGRLAALHALRSICFECTAVLRFLQGREISKNWADPDYRGDGGGVCRWLFICQQAKESLSLSGERKMVEAQTLSLLRFMRIELLFLGAGGRPVGEMAEERTNGRRSETFHSSSVEQMRRWMGSRFEAHTWLGLTWTLQVTSVDIENFGIAAM
ncbi:hypothetical protein DL98DRAFT_518275, partial [Cadophora sp. DSE1049]